jgi:hypothetical protein
MSLAVAIAAARQILCLRPLLELRLLIQASDREVPRLCRSQALAYLETFVMMT